MKLHILGIALLAASTASLAQTQSGSGIGSNTGGSVGGSASVEPRPLPLPLPSTGTSGDTAGTRGTSPRSAESSVGSSNTAGGVFTGPSSGLCDTLIGDERAKCLREQASTGTSGAGSTGMGSGTTR
jgi:hypothetical protein